MEYWICGIRGAWVSWIFSEMFMFIFLTKLLGSGHWQGTGTWRDHKLYPIITTSSWALKWTLNLLQFLSMKLEAVNTRTSPGIEGFPSKDVSTNYCLYKEWAGTWYLLVNGSFLAAFLKSYNTCNIQNQVLQYLPRILMALA